MRIIGIVPARMKASRFPGKPLHLICGKPMIEHCFERAKMFENWTHLALATCDAEIESFGKSKDYQVIMTSDKHTRCLDRVAEAAGKLVPDIKDNDIVVCVQGDEPLLHPEMIAASIAPCIDDEKVPCTVLAMDIVDDEMFRNPHVVKLVHDQDLNVLYTSRAPIPYCEKLTPSVGAKRIYGIFAFRWHFLKTFNSLSESPLEIVESCDSNRICDNGFKQKVAPYPFAPSFAVDTPEDIALVESAMGTDPLWGKY